MGNIKIKPNYKRTLNGLRLISVDFFDNGKPIRSLSRNDIPVSFSLDYSGMYKNIIEYDSQACNKLKLQMFPCARDLPPKEQKKLLISIVKELSDIVNNDPVAFQQAIERQMFNPHKSILPNRIDLIKAIRKGSEKEIEEALNRGVDINEYYYTGTELVTPLFYALCLENQEIVEFLLQKGASTSIEVHFMDHNGPHDELRTYARYSPLSYIVDWCMYLGKNIEVKKYKKLYALLKKFTPAKELKKIKAKFTKRPHIVK